MNSQAPPSQTEPVINPLRHDLAKNIRRLAFQQKLNLSKLAESAGVSRAQLYLVLRARSSPSVDWLCRVAKALEVDPGSLLESEDSSNSSVEFQL